MIFWECITSRTVGKVSNQQLVNNKVKLTYLKVYIYIYIYKQRCAHIAQLIFFSLFIIQFIKFYIKKNSLTNLSPVNLGSSIYTSWYIWLSQSRPMYTDLIKIIHLSCSNVIFILSRSYIFSVSIVYINHSYASYNIFKPQCK